MAQNFLSDIKLGDSIYIRLGDRSGGDLNLYHNGTNTFIDNHTGQLYIRNFSDDKNIHLQSDDGSGGMTDYIVVHGSENIVKFQENTRHLDNKQARFGTGSDLKIFHDGTNNQIRVEGGSLDFEQHVDDGTIRFYNDNGSGGQALYFYLDGSTVRTQFNKQAYFIDNAKVTFGDGEDLQIYHDGSTSFIKDAGTGNLEMWADGAVIIKSGDGTETKALFDTNGSVDLYYDNSKKFETTSAGIKLPSYGAGYLKTDANGNVSVDTSTIEDTLQTVTDRGSTTTNTMQGTRLGLGGAPHASAALQITTTAQHMRLFNGSELGVIHLLSGGELELWAHGDGETINFRTGSGSGVLAAHIDGTNTTFAGNVGIGDAPDEAGHGLEIHKDGSSDSIGILIHNKGTNAADDAKISFETQGSMDYTIGIDRSDGNKFKISRAGDFGTNDTLTLATNNSATFAGTITTGGDLTIGGTGGIFIPEYIYHVGDTNNYFGFPSADHFKVATSGSDALTIDSNQNAIFAAPVWIPDFIYHTGDANTKFGFGGNDSFQVNTSGAVAFSIDTVGDATFAGEITSGSQVTVDSNWVSDQGSLSIVHDQNTLGGIGIVANSVYKGGLIQRDGTAGNFMELTTYTAQPLKLRTNNTDTLTVASNGETTIKRTVDGNFTGLRIMNQKTYGSGTGNNERPRLALGIAETSTPDSDREGFVIESLTPSETDSSHINTIFKTRTSGSVTNHILLEGSSKQTTFSGNVSTAADKRISIGTWDNSAFTGGAAHGYYVSAGTPILILEESDQSKTGYVGVSGGNMYVGGVVNNFYVQTNDGTTRLTIDSSGDATFAQSVNIGASKKIYLGGSTARMHIYHTGSGGTANILTKEGDLNLVNQSHGDDIVFKTENSSGTVVTPLTLDSGGTANFAGDVIATGDTRVIKVTNTNGNTALQLLSDSSGDGQLRVNDSGGTTKIFFYGEANNNNYINNGGNLGIGTNNPSYKLQVQGTFYVNETAYINGVTTIDASLNQTGGDASTFSGNLSAKKLTSTDGVLELDDNGTHNGIINSPASLRINIDSNNDNTGESFQVANNATNIDSNNILFKVEESGNATFAGNILMSGSNANLKSDQIFQFLTTGSNAQIGKFKSIQLSTSYSGTPPSQGILFGTDTNLYRDSANVLKTDDSLVVAGDLTVNGTTTTVNQENLDVSDNIIGLNRGLTGTNANDSGIIIERGSSGDNAAFIWDESIGYFSFGTTQKTPSATGAVANESDWTWKPIKASGAVFTGTITTDRLSLFTTSTDRATIRAGSSGVTGHLYLSSWEGTDEHVLTWSGANNGFYPQGASGSFSLGLTGNRWSNVYTAALSVSGNATAASFTGRLQGAVTGAPDSTIWCVSGQYTNWGIFYNEGSPDLIEFKSGGTVQASIALDNGNFETNGQAIIKGGDIRISTDGTYGGSYGTVGFGGTSNGGNRVFGHTGTSDGLFLASATGRGIFFRVNGGSTDNISFNSDGSATFTGDVKLNVIKTRSADLDFYTVTTGRDMRFRSGNNSVQLRVKGDNSGIQIHDIASLRAASVTSATTTTTVSSVPIATYGAAFFDYVAFKGTNIRAGTIAACNDGTNVSFAETSTTDLGDTSDVTFAVDISSGDMRLRATTASSTWTIKALIRGI